MTEPSAHEQERRVLVLAPNEKDGALTLRLLTEARLPGALCRDLGCLCEELERGAGAAVLTEQDLNSAAFPQLLSVLERQPPWSELPFVVLTAGGTDATVGTHALEALGNVIRLEQPVRIATLVSALQMALRSRQRQYQVRNLLEAREQATARERAAHETFRHLVEHSPFGVYVVDADFRLVQVSAGAQKVFENVRPLLGRDFAEVLRIIWPEPFASEAIALFRHTLKTGEPYHAPRTIERRGDIDAVQSYDWKIERLTLPDGRFGTVCHFYDLSERQQYEEALRKSEERHRKLFEANLIGVMTMLEDGRILDANDAFLNMLGYTRHELEAGRLNWQAMTPPDVLAAEREWIEKNPPRSGRVAPYEKEYLRKDGSRVPVLLGGTFLHGDSGEGVCFVLDITDRKQMEEALRQSRERLTLAQTGGGVGVWDWVSTTGETYWSEQMWVLYGYPASVERKPGNAFWESCLHPDDRGRVMEEVAHFLASTEREYAEEFRIVRPDGAVRWVESVARLERAPDGAPTRFSGINRDITRRKEVELALRYSNEQFETLLNQAPLGVYVVDADFRIRQVNPVALPVFGDIPGGVIGRDFDEIIHLLWEKEYADETVRIFRRTLETGESYVTPERAEFRIDRGVTEYYEWRVDRITLPDGRYGVVCYFRDISQWVLAQQAIRESEARFRQLADAMPQVVWIADSSGTVFYYNSRVEQFADALSEQDGTWQWQPFVHPDDLEHTQALWHAAVTSGEPYQCQHRIRVADGSYRYYLSRAIPVTQPNGEVRWYGTATDIHDLRLAQQALEEADHRKDEFLAMLAHELRNPLAPIRNAAELLRHGELSPLKLQRASAIVERQANHMARLIDDLLDVSRITRGTIELRKEPLDLLTVVAPAVEISRPLLEARHHELTSRLASGPLWIEGDPTRLAQVIANLLVNAAKFTPDHGRIELVVAEAGDEAVVRVRDNGRGIEATQLATIFDLFRQVDSSLDRAQGGLGIGLTLVRSLVERHGGFVEAHSAGLGKGSEFVVRLPRFVAPREISVPSDGKQISEGLSSRRILVVDDNKDAAETLGEVLALLGHQVETAFDGPQALEVAQAFQPEVVFLDLGLPGMNGYEVAKQLAEKPETQQAMLVAVSGYGHEEAQAQGKLAGFTHHLVKPVNLDRVQALITRS